jgi:hypothetical protein
MTNRKTGKKMTLQAQPPTGALAGGGANKKANRERLASLIYSW